MIKNIAVIRSRKDNTTKRNINVCQFFFTLWIGENLSYIEQLTLASYVYHGHKIELYCYNNISNIPKGVIIKNANEIITYDKINVKHTGSHAHSADHFRFEALYQKGGTWVDMDMLCVSSQVLTGDHIFGWQNNDHLNTAIIRLPPGSPISRLMVSRMLNINTWTPIDTRKERIRKTLRLLQNKNSPYHTGWGELSGPIPFTRAVKHFNLISQADPQIKFYPLDCFESIRPFWPNEDLSDVIEKTTFSIHLWSEMLARTGIKRYKEPPQGSYIKSLLDLYKKEKIIS